MYRTECGCHPRDVSRPFIRSWYVQYYIPFSRVLCPQLNNDAVRCLSYPEPFLFTQLVWERARIAALYNLIKKREKKGERKLDLLFYFFFLVGGISHHLKGVECRLGCLSLSRARIYMEKGNAYGLMMRALLNSVRLMLHQNAPYGMYNIYIYIHFRSVSFGVESHLLYKNHVQEEPPLLFEYLNLYSRFWFMYGTKIFNFFFAFQFVR